MLLGGAVTYRQDDGMRHKLRYGGTVTQPRIQCMRDDVIRAKTGVFFLSGGRSTHTPDRTP